MKQVTYYPEDVPEDIPEKNFIPIAKKVRFPWIMFTLMNVYFLLIGFSIGWMTGYTAGIQESINLIEEVRETLEEPNDGITEGHMPW